MTPSISISIPAYNEEAALPAVIKEAQEVLSALTPDWEILVVNDGSKDSTGAIAEGFAKQDPRIRVIHHAVNEGFGKTIAQVFTEPRKEWVFLIPGDGQVRASEIHKLKGFMDKADFILGRRVHRADPASRRLNAAVYNRLVSLVLGQRVHDVDSVVLYRRSLLKNFSLDSRSVFIHAEFLLKAVRSGARWIEVPIEHKPRQGGKALGAKLSVIWQTFSELVHYAIQPGLHPERNS